MSNFSLNKDGSNRNVKLKKVRNCLMFPKGDVNVCMIGVFLADGLTVANRHILQTA